MDIVGNPKAWISRDTAQLSEIVVYCVSLEWIVRNIYQLSQNVVLAFCGTLS